MTTTPDVSVLVLAYNHGPYLADALDSILKQESERTVEVLIGEDRSTDDTLTVARDYERRFPAVVRVITDEVNVGMQGNLQRLVRAARGRHLAFCEGDDYWNPCTKLEVQSRFLDEHPDHGAVHGNFDHIALVDGEWRALPRYWEHRRVEIPEGEVFDELLCRNFIQTCTLMVRRDLTLDYLDSGLPVGQYKVGDWPLCLFIASRGSIGYDNASLATYRRVPGSATNLGYKADLARAHDHLRMVADFSRLLNVPPEIESAAERQAMRNVLDLALCAGDADEMASALQWFREHGGVPRFSAQKRMANALLARGVAGGLIRWSLRRRSGRDLSSYCSSPHPPGDCA